MDPGIGHEIEVNLQAYGYPVLWTQYLPLDADLLGWIFGPDIAAGEIRSPLDIADVWPSSYSANTNEILWAHSAPIIAKKKVAAPGGLPAALSRCSTGGFKPGRRRKPSVIQA